MKTFNYSIPLKKVKLPSLDNLKKYINQIDQNLIYSNDGPLLKNLQKSLAEKFFVNYESIVITSSGTIGLEIILKNLVHQKKNRIDEYFCLLPSFTFVASAMAIINAGLKPIFLDIEFETGQLSPEIVEKFLLEKKINQNKIIAVMPVSPFGAKINKEVWDIFKIKHDIDIVYDEAWSFDTFKKGIHGNSVISLHATKSLGCGEGGVIIAKTTEEGEKFRRLINFGFDENKNSDFVGTNAKMSEYSAAVALASLDGWKKNKKEILIKQSYYLNKINSFSNVQVLAGFTNKWVWGALPIILNNSKELSKLIEAAKLQGIEMRNWWGPGVHRFPWSKQYMNFNLVNTNKYCYKLINIPFFQEISFDHINKVCEILKNFDI